MICPVAEVSFLKSPAMKTIRVLPINGFTLLVVLVVVPARAATLSVGNAAGPNA